MLTEGGGEAAVTLLSVTYHRHAAGPYNPPSENGQYAVAEVSVRVMKGEYAYGPIYFQYQAGDGTTYSWGDGHGLASGYEPLLPSGILGAGESARGLVVFDVPTGPGGLIRLTGAAGVVLGQWRLNA